MSEYNSSNWFEEKHLSELNGLHVRVLSQGTEMYGTLVEYKGLASILFKDYVHILRFNGDKWELCRGIDSVSLIYSTYNYWNIKSNEVAPGDYVVIKDKIYEVKQCIDTGAQLYFEIYLVKLRDITSVITPDMVDSTIRPVTSLPIKSAFYKSKDGTLFYLDTEGNWNRYTVIDGKVAGEPVIVTQEEVLKKYPLTKMGRYEKA